MVKAIYKYYLKFPPVARRAINLSLSGFMNGMGIDYYVANTEDILFDCDDMFNKTLFN